MSGIITVLKRGVKSEFKQMMVRCEPKPRVRRLVRTQVRTRPYLHLLSFTNILVVFGWRRQPHIAEGQLSLWLPAKGRQKKQKQNLTLRCLSGLLTSRRCSEHKWTWWKQKGLLCIKICVCTVIYYVHYIMIFTFQLETCSTSPAQSVLKSKKSRC